MGQKPQSGFVTLLFFTLLYLFNFPAHAYSKIFPMNARVIGSIAASDSIQLLAADGMIPIYGNNQSILHLDGYAKLGSDSTWLASFGAGVRNIFYNNEILGGYFFLDDNKNPDGTHFIVANPGVELIFPSLDFHVNGYFPFHKKNFGTKQSASSLGNNNFLYFKNHSEYDKLFAIYNIIGNGLDDQIGYSIPYNSNRLRIFAGSYFYTPPKVKHIIGIEAGIEYPVTTNFKIVFQDSIDNVFHNSALVSIQISFGMPYESAHNIEERFLDPIPRHLGTLRTGNGVCNQQHLEDTGQSVLVDDNLWFFQPGFTNDSSTPMITYNSCTFEHPCIGISQTVINSINNVSMNAKLLLAPGQYAHAEVGSGFTLQSGQSIFGKTQNYLELAQDNNRAFLNDTLFLSGNNLVSNLQINGQSDVIGGLHISRTGLMINASATGDIQVINTNILSSTTDNNHDARGFLNASLNANVKLQNSTVTASTSGDGSSAFGATNLGNLQINSSTLIGNSFGSTTIAGSMGGAGIINTGAATITNSVLSGNAFGTNAFGVGVFNEDFGTFQISDSTITSSSTILSEGVFNEDLGEINIINSKIITHSDTESAGIFNEDLGSITISNSTITTNAPVAAGVFNEDLGKINIANSIIDAHGSIEATGISNEDVGDIIVSNSIIKANGSGTVTAIKNNFPAQIHLIGTNQCFENGVLVSCI